MNTTNYRRFIVIGLLLSLVLTISGCKNNKEDLVAKVDGEVITKEEFESDFQLLKKGSEQTYGEDAMSQVGENGRTLEEELKEYVVEKLIMEKLIEKEAKDMNIEVTSEEIDKQMEQYIAAMEGEDKFNEFLKSNKLSREFFEENLEKELLFNKHKEVFMNNISIDEKEAKKYFDSNKENLVVVKANHILVKTEDEGKKVLERLKAGEDFGKLAGQVSIDKASASQGGSLGYISRGDMRVEFEKVAFTLKPGETSDLVKTEVGYHIIHVEDKKDTYEALKNDIIPLLKKDKYVEKLQKLRDNAKVKIYLDIKNK